jgi:hypothetical protein
MSLFYFFGALSKNNHILLVTPAVSVRKSVASPSKLLSTSDDE